MKTQEALAIILGDVLFDADLCKTSITAKQIRESTKIQDIYES